MSNKKLLQAAAGTAAAGGDPLYVEDVFSTYLYDGNGSNRSITNGIDLAGEGGLVWAKMRSGTPAGGNNVLYDTERGAGKYLISDLTSAQSATDSVALTSFNSNGFSLGVDNASGLINYATRDYATWTFRKAEKFFDVVTYTGDGVAGRTVAHNLGSTPAVMIFKRTDASSGNWPVYVSALGATDLLRLNIINASFTSSDYFNDTAPTDSVFTVGSSSNINASGGSYVAYLFASDAGGFGDDGDENIIKCGSFTTNGSGNAVISNLGFEPSWLMIKRSSGGSNWEIRDDMRGFGVGASVDLKANVSDAESSPEANKVFATATGFEANVSSSSDYIYIAIRRPMKTPEAGTEVFAQIAKNSTTPTTDWAVGFPADMFLEGFRTLAGVGQRINTRLTGGSDYLETWRSNATFDGFGGGWDEQDSYSNATGGVTPLIGWFFKRAPGFMDVVAYTGTSSARNVPHNLGVVPEFIIVKNRDSNDNWICYHSGNTAAPATEVIKLNETDGTSDYDAAWNDTAPTSSVFTVGHYSATNNTGQGLIAYLFATLAGVSKVGSYTGTGSDLNVDCGFTAGARFILIKRTDSSGDWYVWDSARGIVAGNDPYLLLNTTAAEVTNTDYIDPLSSGFTVTSSAPAALNASGGNYIFLAIA